MATRFRERAGDEARPQTGPAPPVDHARPPTWILPALVVLGCALRVWRALHNGLSFDESFTGIAGRRALGDLVPFLRDHDSHPPLDYLLRMPLARAGVGDFALRAPSLLFSCAALALFAWWMRDRCWVGVLATALFAVSTFQALHGGEARMYALLQLLGVGAAMVGERWLRAPRRAHAWGLGAIVLLALFDHASGLLLGLGLLVLCGARRDREAWRLRGALAVAGGLWSLSWTPTLVEQLGNSWSSWVPRTTPSGFARVVSEQVVTVDGIAWLVLAAVVAGGVVLVRDDRELGAVWLACGVVPFAAAAAIGLFTSFLLARTLTLASWAPVIALAFLLDVARRKWHVVGTALAAGAVAFVLVATAVFFHDKTWDYDLSMRELERVAQPGDVVAVRPARYGILADWRFEVQGDRPTADVRFDAIRDTDARRVLGAAPTGRVWMLTTVGSPTEFEGFVSCAEPWTDDVTTIVCLTPAGP